VDGAGPAHGANDAPPTVPWKTGERLPVFHTAHRPRTTGLLRQRHGDSGALAWPGSADHAQRSARRLPALAVVLPCHWGWNENTGS